MTDPVQGRVCQQVRLCTAAVKTRACHGATRYKNPNRVVIHHSSLSPPIMSSSELPLPYGWTQEFDAKTNHPFWVSNTSIPLPYDIRD
jgi:hypothetical protein